MITLRDAIVRAWDRTKPCKDGMYTNSAFCPSCLYASLREVLEETASGE